MRKWIVLLVSLSVMLCALPVAPLAASTVVTNGDVNGDHMPDTADVRLVLKAITELVTLSNEQLHTADINQDGVVNSADVRRMLLNISNLTYDDLPETPAEDFSYTAYEDSVIINRYLGKAATVKIPAKIAGKPVTTIMFIAFTNSAVETVIMPDTITKIWEKAFIECPELTEVRFSKTLTEIGNEAFERCPKLERVDLPETLQRIDDFAFSDCASLSEVIIRGTNLIIDMCAFSGNPSLKTVTMSGVKKIGYAAFAGANELESVVIPETVETIYSLAFANCDKFTTATFLGDLPASIDEDTFRQDVIIPTLRYKKGAKGTDNPKLSNYILEEYE